MRAENTNLDNCVESTDIIGIMDKFREAELSQGSELSRVLNEIKKTEARINHTEREVLNLEQHISGVKVAIEVLQTERKVIQEKGDKCKVRRDIIVRYLRISK